MQWQTAIPNASEINSSAAQLLDALEVLRPLGEHRVSRSALGRWIMESGQDGTIGDDTVVWLHHLLLPTPARIGRHRPVHRSYQSAA
ncbi:MAG: hypothetical protein LC797_14750 [Chloroflexi bacterium]|nr:hypothetical protein [Chloroflexota bacterium]